MEVFASFIAEFLNKILLFWACCQSGAVWFCIWLFGRRWL